MADLADCEILSLDSFGFYPLSATATTETSETTAKNPENIGESRFLFTWKKESLI